jgi:hypothetical protein
MYNTFISNYRLKVINRLVLLLIKIEKQIYFIRKRTRKQNSCQGGAPGLFYKHTGGFLGKNSSQGPRFDAEEDTGAKL